MSSKIRRSGHPGLTPPWNLGLYTCMTKVWTDKSEPLFSNVKVGVIIFKPRSAKGLLQFTEEVIITQRQTRTLTWVFECCQSKFSDLASGFVTDVWPHFFMHQQNVQLFLMWSRRHSLAWSFFRVSTYVSELMVVPRGTTFTSRFLLNREIQQPYLFLLKMQFWISSSLESLHDVTPLIASSSVVQNGAARFHLPSQFSQESHLYQSRTVPKCNLYKEVYLDTILILKY